MARAPKKQSEILIIGQGSIAELCVRELTLQNKRPLHITDSKKVHFVGNNLVSNAGEKVGFRRALLILDKPETLPSIRGLERTPHSKTSDKPSPLSAKGLTIVVGGKADAVSYALAARALGAKVAVLTPDGLLPEFDISVQDATRRHLKSLGITFLGNSTPIACAQKGAKIALLTKSASLTTQLAADYLAVEPVNRQHPEIGLKNQGFYKNPHEWAHQNNVLSVDQDAPISISELLMITNKLQNGRGSLPSPPHHRHTIIGDTQLISFGQLEQNLQDTHLGYKKSIVRTNDKTQAFHGFIKVLTSTRGKIISISGIVPVGVDTELLYSLVKHRADVSTLLDFIPLTNNLREELLEVRRELAKG